MLSQTAYVVEAALELLILCPLSSAGILSMSHYSHIKFSPSLTGFQVSQAGLNF